MQRIHFHQELDHLRARLLTMGGLAEQAIDQAVLAYRSIDPAQCDRVLRAAPAIDQMEREIDRTATALLAREQPMATDLRLILAVLRINADLERVGDQAANIARLARDLTRLPATDLPHAELPIDVPRMAEITRRMIRLALAAFVSGDREDAEEALALDEQVDALNHDAFDALSDLIQQQPDLTTQALNGILVARNLERIGDHATNIAEDVIFWISGNNVRHSADLRVVA